MFGFFSLPEADCVWKSLPFNSLEYFFQLEGYNYKLITIYANL